MDPARESSTLLCDSLKSELKAFERSFFEANGRKPGRADIKAAGDIAPKYKEYARLRDLLNGQGEPSSPKRKEHDHAPESQTPTKKVKTTKVHAATPSRRHSSKHATLATPSKHHDGQEEPQEAPLSATKIFNDSYMRSLLGPTPQKDGYVLGIFDLLPSATPSKERNVLGDIAANQTTPRKQESNESDDVWSGRRARFGRTPMSEGKRHYLDQFMSTPLKRKRDQEEQPTPSSKGAETPAFLRRDWRPMESLKEEPESPKMTKKPRVLMRSISTILQERRKEREEDARKAVEEAEQAEAAWQAQQHEDQDTDGDHDDELEAMRELEAEQAPMSSASKNTARRLFTSKAPAPPTAQPAEMSLGADGETNPSDGEDDGEANASAAQETRPWKKRGAKRQTRRVIMRPVHARSKPQPQLETIPSEDENDSSDATCVPETQYNDVALANPSSDTVVQAHDGSDTDTAVEEDGSDFSDHEEEKPKSQRKPNKKPAATTAKDARDKDGGNVVKRTARKISATAHANFCRLKIKNKNSKGKAGGGRSWGRNRR
ncbi:DNA replication/checkpoint protein [Phyllosticta capitalensis]|uniref:DNA replication regulator SLD2 n=1 Tax=Phyllosticta capitalensis TaxID=121624 RepID=A0ABR1YF44_9PEZI